MIRSLVLLFSLATLWAAPAGAQAQKEVLAAMDALKTATMGKDVAALGKLFNDNLTYTHSNANNQTKAEVLKAVGADTSTIEAIDLTDTSVHVFGNAALIRTDFHIRRTTNGNTVTTHLNILFAWVKTPGGWQLAARHSTAIPAK
jgi:ketosteroid isomerase-like protein